MRLLVSRALLILAAAASAPAALADTTHIYRGAIGGGTGELVISETAGGAIGKLSVGAHECGGTLAGSVEETATSAILQRPPAPGAQGECAVTFTKVPGGITSPSVSETPGCMPWHGASCDFSGANLKQVR